MYVVYHYLAQFADAVIKHWVIFDQSTASIFYHSNGFEMTPVLVKRNDSEVMVQNLNGKPYDSAFYNSAGVQRAASPWRTLGIRSCWTLCSDLACS